MNVAVGADHGGFLLKEALKPYLEKLGHGVIDVGASSGEPADYPDFAALVAETVASGRAMIRIQRTRVLSTTT